MAERQISYRHTLVNSIGTFLSRVTGVLKQPLLSYLFGAAADPFVLAFRITNTFRRYIGEGAVTNALIPIYKKSITHDSGEVSNRFASSMITFFFLLSLVVTILGAVLAPFYFPPLALGLKQGSPELEQAIRLVMLMMPFTIFISLFAVAMGLLNSNKKFFSAAFAPVLFNVSFILCPLLLSKQLGVYSLGLGVVLGGVAMALAVWLELLLTGFRYRFVLDRHDPKMKEFFSLFGPSSLNMLVLTIKNLATTQFLSFWRGASLIFLNVITLIEAPLGIIGIAIGTVMLPVLSQHKPGEAEGKFENALSESFSLLLFLIIPISVFFIIFPDTVVNVFFRDTMRLITGNTGRYGDLMQKTYSATALYSIALIPMACTILLERVFYAVRDAKTPLIANIAIFVTSFGIYFTSFIPSVGFYGVLLGDVAAAWMTLVFYGFRMRKVVDFKPLVKRLTPKLAFQLAASGIAALGVYFFHTRIYLHPHSAIVALGLGAAEVGIFSLIYFALALIFRMVPHR